MTPFNRPHIPPHPPKPTTGRLWFGTRIIAENEPFRNLQARKTELIQQGYDKRFLKITY